MFFKTMVFKETEERMRKLETEINQLIEKMFNENLNITAKIEDGYRIEFLVEIKDSGPSVIKLNKHDSLNLESKFKLTKSKSNKKHLILDALKHNSSWHEDKWYDYIIEPATCELGAKNKALELINNHIKEVKEKYLDDINNYLNNDDKRIAQLWRSTTNYGKIEPLYNTSLYDELEIIERFPTIKYKTGTAEITLEYHTRKSEVTLNPNFKALTRLSEIKNILEYISNNIDALFYIQQNIKEFYIKINKIKNLDVTPNVYLSLKHESVYIDNTKINLETIEKEDLEYIEFSLNKVLKKYIQSNDI